MFSATAPRTKPCNVHSKSSLATVGCLQAVLLHKRSKFDMIAYAWFIEPTLVSKSSNRNWAFGVILLYTFLICTRIQEQRIAT